jgi:hypothetical protein
MTQINKNHPGIRIQIKFKTMIVVIHYNPNDSPAGQISHCSMPVCLTLEGASLCDSKKVVQF